MPPVKINHRVRKKLQTIVRADRDADKVRRAEAILWLDEGVTVTEIAKRLQVQRGTIYNWVTRFHERSGGDMDYRLAADASPGRPSEKRELVKRITSQILGKSPIDFGFCSHAWSSMLIHKLILKQENMDISLLTVRRALRELNLRFKRPRYSLARRSPTWQQAKGGSNAAWQAESGW